MAIAHLKGEETMPKCKECNDIGVINTGNNDLPCNCPAGAIALFNEAGVEGAVTGEEIRRHFLNNSPEPIRPGRNPILASDLPGRKKGVNLDELQQEAEKLLALLNDRQPGLMTWNEFLHERLHSLHALTSKALGK